MPQHCKIYAPFLHRKILSRAFSKQFIKSDLRVQCVPHGVIATDAALDSFGVFDSAGNFIKESRQIKEGKNQPLPNANLQSDETPYIDEDALFLGRWNFIHFGHFLLEHMNRAYPLLSSKYKNLKCVILGHYPHPEYVEKLLGMLGVKPENIMTLNKTMRFRNVIVPEQSFVIPNYTAKEFGDTFAAVAARVKQISSCEKIYVSRSELAQKTFGEERIQNIFRKNGFQILHPEKLPLTQQIAIMKNCKILAGVAGTALHLALFMPSGGMVVQIKRNRGLRDNAEIQHLVNMTSGLRSVFVSASTEKYKTRHGSTFPQIIGTTKYMRQFFDDNGFAYDKSDLEFDRKSYEDYLRAITAHRAKNGNLRMNNIKHSVVMILACIVPGKKNRRVFRETLAKFLQVGKN